MGEMAAGHPSGDPTPREARLLDALDAIRNLAAGLGAVADVPAIAALAVDATRQALRLRSVSVYLVEDGGVHLLLRGAGGASEDAGAPSASVHQAEDRAAQACLGAEGGDQGASEPPGPDTIADAGAQVAVLAEPMLGDGRLIGVMTFAQDGPGLDPVAERLAQTIAAQTAQGIRRSMLLSDAARSQREIAENRDLLLAITEATSDLVHVKDLDGRYRLVNHNVAALLGRSADDLLGRSPAEVFGVGRNDAPAEHDRQVLELGAPAVFEESVNVLGDERLFSSSRAPLFGLDGEPIGIVGISRDVTELRRLEAALSAARDSEARDRWRSVLDSMLDLVTIQRAVRDQDGVVVDLVIEYVNSVNIDIAGRAPEDLVGRSVLELYPAMTSSPLFDAYVRALDEQEVVIIDQLPWHEEIDGREVTGSYSVQVVPFEDGLVVCARDITDALRERELLAQTNEQLNAAQGLAHIGIWAIDLATGAITFSPELSRIFGLAPHAPLPPADEVLAQFLHPADLPRAREFMAGLQRSSSASTVDVRAVHGDGTIRNLSIFGTATRGEDGEVERLWGTAQDVTEQRRAEEALRRTAESLDREHATVTLLQRSILPDLPAPDEVAAELTARYLPAGGASQVGGDWYDVFALEPHRIALVVGDVAGHGLPAAGLMAQLRNALRAHAYNGLGPAEAFDAMSRLMSRTNATEFATCLYAVLDLEAQTLSWSRAGHPPLAICRAGITTLHESPVDTPFGAMPDHAYGLETQPIASGDVIVLYTDGLVERRDESIDAGLERLVHTLSGLSHLPVDDLCDRLCQQMLGGRSGSDDVCVLALRVP